MIATQDIIIHNCEQGSEEWHKLRLGKLTGTSASQLLTKAPEGKIGAGLRTTLYKNIGQIITGEGGDDFSSKTTERGNALEPIARQAYQDETFMMVDLVGFIQKGEYLGTSPDGLIFADGGAEIKCPEATEFVRYLDTGMLKDEKKYLAQIQWNMFITGRDWWDYIVFHPEFGERSLNHKRINRDESVMDIFERKTSKYIAELERILSTFK